MTIPRANAGSATTTQPSVSGPGIVTPMAYAVYCTPVPVNPGATDIIAISNAAGSPPTTAGPRACLRTRRTASFLPDYNVLRLPFTILIILSLNSCITFSTVSRRYQ